MLSTRIRIILVFMLCLSNFLINTSYTDADIFAERIVRANRFSMSTLDISTRHSANNAAVSYVFRTFGLVPGGFDLGAVRVRKEGKLNSKYRLKVIKTSGNDALCNALNVEVLQRNLTVKYQGKLLDLNFNSESKDESPEDWIIIVGLENKDKNLENKICEFSLNLRTWRTEPDEKKGIYAERILNNVISSGNW